MSEIPWCPDPVPPADEPQGCRNSGADSAYSYLCEQGWTPLLITGTIRDFLTRQWSDPANVTTPILKKQLWSEGPDTGILIESSARFRADVVAKSPSIFIKRNSVKLEIPGMFGGESLGAGNIAYANEKGAHHIFDAWVTGSHTLFCVSSLPAATETLAIEVLIQVLTFSPVFRRQLELHGFMPFEMGPVQPLKSADDRYVVPITIAWTYQHSWDLFEESLPLQKVELIPKFDQNGGLVLSSF